jgi:polyisoprenyl-phosphate glycosyltransferase
VRPTFDVDLSVIVPTYKGAESLPELVERLDALFAARRIRGEIILVNDASPDATWSVIEGLAETHPSLMGIELLTNHGQATATLCGIAQARGTLVGTIDDDLQQYPEDFDVLLVALEEHPDWDAVVGTWPRDQNNVAKRLGSRLHAAADRYAHGTPKGLRHTSFRVMRRPLAEALIDHETRTPVLGPLLTQLSNRVHNVPVRHAPRLHGQSTITMRESIDRVINNIVHGTTRPLRLLARLGIVAAVGSLLVAAYLLARFLMGSRPPEGWTSVFVAVVFFGGASLLGIATIGRYLSVIVEETRGRPKWSIRNVSHRSDTQRSVPLRSQVGDRSRADTA